MNALRNSVIIGFAKQHNLPILIHTGPDKYSDPDQIVELALLYPGVRFCAAHAGQFQTEFINCLVRSPKENLFVDTSPFISLCFVLEQGERPGVYDLPFSNAQKALLSLYELLPDNLMWGTDEPWTTITDDATGGIRCRVTYANEADLLKGLPVRIRQKIAHDNTLRFLGQ